MNDSIAYIGVALKQARENKGLSQRALAKKTGVPQSHISKIENGMIDLQASSLIEISRALELELLLVPRKWVPTFQTLLSGRNENEEAQIPAYRLDHEEGGDDV